MLKEIALYCLSVAFVCGGVVDLDLDNVLQVLDEDERIDLSDLGLKIYGQPNTDIGEALDAWTNEDAINPEEIGSYLEGDILVPRPAGRNGLAAESTRWPGGNIPFVIDGDFNAKEMLIIEDALNEYRSRTCIRFTPRLGEKDYISIESARSGCWSSVGRIGGKQVVNLQSPGCLVRKGTVIHELMHAVGFLHEQNRVERDDHVIINWNNIPNDVRNNFDKAQPGTTNDFGVRYDYGSVMHYSGNAFSTNGQPTIVAKIPAKNMGQREGFSDSDVTKIRTMYKCSK